jgi:hypothetical protein
LPTCKLQLVKLSRCLLITVCFHLHIFASLTFTTHYRALTTLSRFTPDHIQTWSGTPDSYVSKTSTIGSQQTQPSPNPHDDNDNWDLLNSKICSHIYH